MIRSRISNEALRCGGLRCNTTERFSAYLSSRDITTYRLVSSKDANWETMILSRIGDEALRRGVQIALDDLFMPDRAVYSPNLELADKAVYG